MPLADVVDSVISDCMTLGTCDIYRREPGTRGSLSGNVGTSEAKVATSWPCTVQAQQSFSSFKEAYQMQQFATNDYIIFGNKIDDYIPQHDDFIKNYVSHDGITDNRTYEIKSVIDGGGCGKHWYLGCDATDKTT